MTAAKSFVDLHGRKDTEPTRQGLESRRSYTMNLCELKHSTFDGKVMDIGNTSLSNLSGIYQYQVEYQTLAMVGSGAIPIRLLLLLA